MKKRRIFPLLLPLLAGAAFFIVSCVSAPEPKLPPKKTDEKTLRAAVQKMTVRQLAGQMIVCGFTGTELSPEFKAFLKKYCVSNVILFSDNMRSVEQTRRVCREIQAIVKENTGFEAFICTDQEGGKIVRLPQELLSLKGASYYSNNKTPAEVFKVGELTAKQLRLCGINVDFAPVMDINSNPKNPIIGERSYGSKASTVVEYGLQMASGLQSGGVVCAVKHFPGHGDTDTDSHLALPRVNKSHAQLKQFELVPFKAAVEAKIPVVMTAHIMFPKIDSKYPATMSHKILTGILRQDLGFDGIIITDDLEMAAIRKNFGIVNGALSAINAGADMVCISVYSDGAGQICDAFVKGLSRPRLEESVLRILKAKASVCGNTQDNYSSKEVASLIKEYNSLMKKFW
ncbi:MAG: beta-N-acetylhexosaminidase [Treponema sp.]|nr:beta-N-acetylhexosaminidase [Treponema sp.]